jgi:Glycosyltransferases involved in cell wall biogenesis
MTINSGNSRCKLSVIIPAYNEERRIGKTLDRYIEYFERKYGRDCEILVVLNGCKDDTESVVKNYISQSAILKYVNFPEPIGKGGAIAKGFVLAQGEFIAYTDADGSAGPEMIDRLFVFLQKNPEFACAIGSRNLPESRTLGRTVFRKLLTKSFNWLVNLLFNLNIQDTQCGAKVLTKAMVERILPGLYIAGLSFDVNLLVEVRKNNGKIAEIPINWFDDHYSTITNPWKSSILMLLSILQLRINNWPFRKRLLWLKPLADWLWSLVLSKKEREYLKIKH